MRAGLGSRRGGRRLVANFEMAEVISEVIPAIVVEILLMRSF